MQVQLRESRTYAKLLNVIVRKGFPRKLVYTLDGEQCS
jgi:hypothetical protein